MLNTVVAHIFPTIMCPILKLDTYFSVSAVYNPAAYCKEVPESQE